jgi:hypothetical protein
MISKREKKRKKGKGGIEIVDTVSDNINTFATWIVTPRSTVSNSNSNYKDIEENVDMKANITKSKGVTYIKYDTEDESEEDDDNASISSDDSDVIEVKNYAIFPYIYIIIIFITYAILIILYFI